MTSKEIQRFVDIVKAKFVLECIKYDVPKDDYEKAAQAIKRDYVG